MNKRRAETLIRGWRPILPALILLAFLFPGRADAQKTVAPDLSTAIIRVAKDNIPAVVHIEVTRSQEVRRPVMPFEGDPFFRFFQDPQQAPRKFKREMRGLGTGMITDAQGHILTNNHVVGGASRVQVLLADGSRFEARVVGTDPKTDLAVVRINAGKPLPHVRFGDSDAVEVGEWVVAIGHPRGLDQTVTTGIISAKHRRGITDPSGYQDFLQTDAAINPGNSGGPLLDSAGRLIGVNSAITSTSGSSAGIGFAVPVDTVNRIVPQLIAKGRVVRPDLGFEALDPRYGGYFGNPKGVIVARVRRGSAADRAGLEGITRAGRRFVLGDVITGVNGQAIRNLDDLLDRVEAEPLGSTVRLEVLRNGERTTVPLRLEASSGRSV